MCTYYYTYINTHTYTRIYYYFKLVARRRGDGVGRPPVGLCRARLRQKKKTRTGSLTESREKKRETRFVGYLLLYVRVLSTPSQYTHIFGILMYNNIYVQDIMTYINIYIITQYMYSIYTYISYTIY